MSEQEKSKNNNMRIAAIVVGSVILVLVIFSAGVSVGIHKARFSNKFAENYERNFMGPKGGPMMDGPGEFFDDMGGRGWRNAHGIAGTIVSIADNSIVIKDRDDKENTIDVNDNTIIKDGRDSIKITDLKNDERIVVMGKPGDNGAINADLIRVFEK